MTNDYKLTAVERYCSISNAIMAKCKHLVNEDKEVDVISATGLIKQYLISTGCFAEEDFENWCEVWE